MFSIILYQPKIPQNTGNIIRLCANTGCQLHLIEPLGFAMDAKALRRAGLDYHEFAEVKLWSDWEHFSRVFPGRIFLLSTKAQTNYSEPHFSPEDGFLFGSETHGLPAEIFSQIDSEQQLTLPMKADSRSLNLSNSVAIVVYEALRQNNFSGF